MKIEGFIKFGMKIHWLRCVDPKNPSQPEKKIQTRREEKNVWTGKIDERNWGEIQNILK